VDDDGDSLADCQDLDCAETVACPATCGVATVLSCDTPVAGTTVGEPSTVGQWSCFDWPQAGGDALFEFIPPSPGVVSVAMITDNGGDLNLFIMEGFGPGDCSPAQCGEANILDLDPVNVSLYASTFQPIFIGVDSVSGEEDSFQIMVDCAGTFVEDCITFGDEDGDGLENCDDPDCATASICVDEEICDNGADEDLDLAIDCDDSDCFGDADCLVEGDCDDGVDFDGDGLVDCDDPDCAAELVCIGETACGDGFDNDDDGDVDCADSDCAAYASCGGPGVEDCDNGLDDDGDGLVDCSDGNCADSVLCTVETCVGGQDEDGDGDIDCADSDCFDSASCVVGSCPAATVLSCGGQVSDAISGAGSTDYYGCGFTAYGGELVYEITSPSSGSVSLALTHDANADLDLVVVDDFGGCALDDCLGYAATSSLTETLAVPVLAGETVYAFVEGASIYDGGSFDLAVECGLLFVEQCDDGQDNDGDGLDDCDDPNCASDVACEPAEDCGNGTDDDGDGAIDCGDSDCDSEPSCQP